MALMGVSTWGIVWLEDGPKYWLVLFEGRDTLWRVELWWGMIVYWLQTSLTYDEEEEISALSLSNETRHARVGANLENSQCFSPGWSFKLINTKLCSPLHFPHF